LEVGELQPKANNEILNSEQLEVPMMRLSGATCSASCAIDKDSGQ
jgi:hypothetical protein